MILPDYPIETSQGDKLKRLPLATKVADVIRSFEGRESFVISIEGPWGSGKTSFLNLVLENLGSPNGVIVINFNPWNFSDQNALITDFFNSIIAAIKGQLSGRAMKVLKSYAPKLRVSFNPSIALGFLNIGLGTSLRGNDKTLKATREEIDKELKLLNKKIVIIIDDIDRLDKKETRLIMKLVKITANFPNTVFLLAYDRERVAKRLEEDGWPGEEYLKKIVQVSFILPEPDRQGLLKILFSDLDETIKRVYGEVRIEGNDEQRWNNLARAGFGDLFKTIRDIKRFISSLRLDWSIIGKDDVNLVDFIGVESFRVFAPSFYSVMASNKPLFTETQSLYVGFNSQEDNLAREKQYKELLAKAPPELLETIDKICKELFPQLNFRSSYGHQWQDEWRKELRVCAEERFNFYFQLGIPEGAVSESEVDSILKTLGSEADFSQNILRFNQDNRLKQLLAKFLDRLEALDEDKASVLILSLWNLEKDIEDKPEAVFDFNNISIQTDRLIWNSLKEVIAKENQVSFIRNIIEKSKTLYAPAKFVYLLGKALEKGGEPIEGISITKDDVNNLQGAIVDQIEEAARTGQLINERKLAVLLFRWQQWGEEERVKSYIKDVTKDRVGLISLLRGFVKFIASTAGNYYIFDKKAIGDLYPINEIEKLVSRITDEEIEKMSEKDQEAIALFRNPAKNHWPD